MKINEDYLDNIELQQDEVSVSEDAATVYPYTLFLKTAVIPKGRGLNFYFDNIIKMNRVVTRALQTFPMIRSFNTDFEIRRLSGGEMTNYDKEIVLADGHRFFDEPERINKHSRSMEFVIPIDIRIETLSQLRRFLLFMWNVFLKAIDASFKAQTSAQAVMLDNGNQLVTLTSGNVETWVKRAKKGKTMFMNAVMFMHPYMRMDDIEQCAKAFIERGESDSDRNNEMTLNNLAKKKAMSQLQKCGLQSVIKDVRQEGDDIIVETDSKMKLQGYQVKQLSSKSLIIFKDVEELTIVTANENQMRLTVKLIDDGQFPELEKVIIQIKTSDFKYMEIKDAISEPEKEIVIDIRNLFTGYDLSVKIKADDYTLLSSNLTNKTYQLKLKVLSDNGIQEETFDVFE